MRALLTRLPTLLLPMFLAGLVGLGAPCSAHAGAGPSPAPSVEDASPAKDGGTIEGRIVAIDYHSGKMTVDVGDGASRKACDVLVVPGTNIQGHKDFHTIADLKKGARVQVLISRHGTTNTAQIIRLL